MTNDEKLDSCGKHNFEPIFNNNNKSVSICRCLECDGIVDSMTALRYSLTGSLEGE